MWSCPVGFARDTNARRPTLVELSAFDSCLMGSCSGSDDFANPRRQESPLMCGSLRKE